MDATIFIAALVLIGCALLLIFYPLWQNPPTKTVFNNVSAGPMPDELQVRYQAQLAAIQELMFDYEMGKVSQEEYEPLLSTAKLEAANIRREIDRLAANTTLDEALESLIAQTRRTTLSSEKGTILQGLDAEIARLQEDTAPIISQTQLACPHCDTPVNSDDDFCSGCGHKLEWNEEVGCSQCGYVFSNTDTYCARCGVLLRSEAILK